MRAGEWAVIETWKFGNSEKADQGILGQVGHAAGGHAAPLWKAWSEQVVIAACDEACNDREAYLAGTSCPRTLQTNAVQGCTQADSTAECLFSLHAAQAAQLGRGPMKLPTTACTLARFKPLYPLVKCPPLVF